MILFYNCVRIFLIRKITRVGTGRLFRKLFPRPAFIPRDTEVALHKYLFVEGVKAPPHEMVPQLYL